MTVQLSVADVRAALARVSGPNASGSGEPATLLLGRLFHEVFADLVRAEGSRGGLRVIAESGTDPKRRAEQLLEHTWQRLLGPRLRQNAASLQASSAQVLVLWRATQNLTRWLGDIVFELLEQRPEMRGSWQELAKLLEAEVSLTCELRENNWTESVKLVGVADSVLRIPQRAGYCAIELKLGQAMPVVDLGQAALYHMILGRSVPGARRSALALMRFSPGLEEHLIESTALVEAEKRLIDLIGQLAGVVRADGKGPKNGSGGKGVRTPDLEVNPEHAELGKRLVRAYREHGVGIELRGEPLPGPRFVRFDVRLTPGMRVDGLRQRTREVQHRLELKAEPMVTHEAGRLYVDLERPDPQTVLFSSIASQLAPLDALRGSAKIALGVDSSGRLRFADLASSGRSHVLAAGTTGSGKSEWLRMMLASLIASNTPDTLRIVTFDPKLAAFADLERSKFLWKSGAFWIPGDGRSASELFQDLIEEMEERYQATRASGSDNLAAHVEKTQRPVARLVCVCDEYFALISQSKEEKKLIEGAVSLLGAKARAAGIHLVLATQQPSRAIITGAIQANLPCRVALALGSTIESNMILGSSGAERLTGAGDLLYKDFGDPVRLQAPYLPDNERERWLRA
jgi:DNA segregation ATPase FtsK/SpoIIIE, S-DNA-T family